MREVTPSQLRRLAGGELSERVEQILAHDEWGCAIYQRSDGMRFAVSYGNRFAEIPYRFPPSLFGDSVLSEYVTLEPVVPDMVSPVLRHLREQQPPQIRMPPRSPSHTVFPEFPRWC
jgi:hypothetical protein